MSNIDRKKMSNVNQLAYAELAEYAEKLANWLISLRSLRTLRALLKHCDLFAVNNV